LPEDEELNEAILNEHESIVSELEEVADADCIVPLLQSFGYGYAYEGYVSALQILERLPEDLVHPALMKAIESDQPGTRMWSIYLLGLFRRPSDADRILPFLNDKRNYVRYHAVNALRMMQATQAVPLISKLLTDSCPNVQSAARAAIDDLLIRPPAMPSAT
jgi:HEAT repeat protein